MQNVRQHKLSFGNSPHSSVDTGRIKLVKFCMKHNFRLLICSELRMKKRTVGREEEEMATVCKWLMLTLSYILLILSVLFFSCLPVEVL